MFHKHFAKFEKGPTFFLFGFYLICTLLYTEWPLPLIFIDDAYNTYRVRLIHRPTIFVKPV